MRNQSLIMAENFVLKPEYRGKGIGSELMEFIVNNYLPKFDGVVLKSTIIEVHNFYKRAGGTVIFDSMDKGREFKYGKYVLKESSIFLFS